VHHDLERCQLGDGEPALLSIQGEVLRYAKRLPVAPAFELRELRPACKKVHIGCVQIPQRHLQGLRIDLLQPGVFRLMFQGGQHPGCVMVIQALLFLALVGGVVIHSLTQEIVVHKARTPELAVQRLTLFSVRVESELESLMDDHHAYFSTDVLVFKRVPPSARRLTSTCLPVLACASRAVKAVVLRRS
jgi:hypothetical protein